MIYNLSQGLNEGCKGSTLRLALNDWEWPKSPNNAASTFFNTVHVLPKDRFEHGGRQTCFSPRVPSNLGTPLISASQYAVDSVPTDLLSSFSSALGIKHLFLQKRTSLVVSFFCLPDCCCWIVQPSCLMLWRICFCPPGRAYAGSGLDEPRGISAQGWFKSSRVLSRATLIFCRGPASVRMWGTCRAITRTQLSRRRPIKKQKGRQGNTPA